MTESAQKLRDQIDAVTNLPTSFAVAVRVIELSRDPEVGCADLAELIATDASLSARFLALTNSAWFGLHQRVTRVPQAINLLGMANARALSVTHSLTGLYHGWKLRAEDATAFWQASLLKAAAGELLAQEAGEEYPDESFTFGLLQDIGVALMASLRVPGYQELLRDENISSEDRLGFERNAFGMDHAECSALLADQIQIPTPLSESIRSHHTDVDQIKTAIAWLPHDIRNWSKPDFGSLDSLIKQQFGESWQDAHAFMDAVQNRYSALIELVTGGSAETPSLAELTARACMVLSQTGAAIVSEHQSLTSENHTLMRHMLATESKHRDAETRATHDALTGLLNRDGFASASQRLVKDARSATRPLALALLDLDEFKQINDAYGHACGDEVLQVVARRLLSTVRGRELVCRWGGDEILIMLTGLSKDDSHRAINRMVSAVVDDPIIWREHKLRLTVSVGIEWIAFIPPDFDLDILTERVDLAMYQNKHTSASSNFVPGTPTTK